jgi:alanine dehydrogenase
MSLSFLDFDQVQACLEPRELVEALRKGFRSDFEMPPRHRHTWGRSNEPDATFVLMPAWQSDAVLGVKLTSIVPGNSARGLASVVPIYLLFDPVTGTPTNVMDGRALTLNRTAATSALAATYLARKDASKLLMMGTGGLAPYLVRAHCALRPIKRVEIWGRNPEKAKTTAASLSDLRLEVHVVENVEKSVAEADIISCATPTTEPLVRGAWLSPGVHLDLVGSFTPTMREADDEAIVRASLFGDKRDVCLREPGDFTQPLAAGIITESSVLADLFALTRGEHHGRKNAEEITLFKSVGLALEDLVAAQLVAARKQ